MKGLVLTLCVAAIWTVLDPEASPPRFVAGCLIGFLFTALFQRVLRTESYVPRTFAVVRFFFIFLWEFVRANLAAAAAVFAPNSCCTYLTRVNRSTCGNGSTTT